jgi:L-aminopeptidase/D-esterase-like protein
MTLVEGLSVGSARDPHERTGCTVVLFDPSAMVAVDARGGYPTTFDTHGIEITKTYIRRHAVYLSGGDVFGLDSPAGIRRYLIGKGTATDRAGGELPMIVGATIYDLHLANMRRVDYPEMAYRACLAASRKPVKEGVVGAGTGATVGNFARGGSNTKSGLGSSAAVLPGGIRIGVIAVPNSIGNIYDIGTGRLVGGAREGGRYIKFEDRISEYVGHKPGVRNTTLGVVATDAELTHEELYKVSQMSHNGLAMAVRPVHTSEDGDTIFAVSTGREKLRADRNRMVDAIGYTASTLLSTAIVRAVTMSRS